MKRRVLAGIHLSGLFMFDVDHVDNPREIFERTQVEGFPWEVVFAHLTSSGKGLRLVCKARTEVGNIADNQIELAKALGVKADASCIDASRISYAPMREDVYLLKEEELLTYYDETFDKEYCETYRSGRTEPTKKTHSFEELKTNTKSNLTNTNFTNNTNGGAQKDSGNLCNSCSEKEEQLSYHGVKYGTICEAWQAA
jgi:hypothetical protein